MLVLFFLRSSKCFKHCFLVSICEVVLALRLGYISQANVNLLLLLLAQAFSSADWQSQWNSCSQQSQDKEEPLESHPS